MPLIWAGSSGGAGEGNRPLMTSLEGFGYLDAELPSPRSEGMALSPVSDRESLLFPILSGTQRARPGLGCSRHPPVLLIIPSAVDPPTRGVARRRGQRWSAPLDERPWAQRFRSAGLARDDGGRDDHLPPPHTNPTRGTLRSATCGLSGRVHGVWSPGGPPGRESRRPVLPTISTVSSVAVAAQVALSAS
jgi:hypothetical protein